MSSTIMLEATYSPRNVGTILPDYLQKTDFVRSPNVIQSECEAKCWGGYFHRRQKNNMMQKLWTIGTRYV